MNTHPFALVSTSISRLIPILFFTKVYRGGPPIRLVKLILLISNTNAPREETFPRRPLFLTRRPYDLSYLIRLPY